MKYNWTEELNLLSTSGISSLLSGEYDLKLVAKDDRGIFKNSEPSESITWTKPPMFTVEASVKDTEGNPLTSNMDLVTTIYPIGGSEEFYYIGYTPFSVVSIPIIDNSSQVIIEATQGAADGSISVTLNGEPLSGETFEDGGWTGFSTEPFVPTDGDLIHFDIVFVDVQA